MHLFLKFIFGVKLHASNISSVHHQEFFSLYTQQTCMTNTISWWWTEELSERCGVLFQT